MGSDVSDSGSIHSGHMLAAVGLAAAKRSRVQSSLDQLQHTATSFEAEVAALQSELTAAHKLNHDLVCSLSLRVFF